MEKGVPIRAISRCLALLQFINRNGPASLMEIARAIALPYPTTVRIVQTLMHEGMLECEPVRKLYRATSLVQTLAVGTHEVAHLLQAARPHLVGLTQAYDWPTSIACGVGASMMLRDSTYGMTSRAFNNYYPGYTFPMLECAAGHAHLSFVDDDVRECLLHGMSVDHRTSVALEMFRSGTLTQRIRSDGYATHDRTENSMNPGKASSIAVPILDGGQVAGVLSLTYFSSAMPMKDAVARYADDLLVRGRAISETLESLR
ncbi:helix-turn-helix domain-containing protein [uncultured Ramlibacter sp.]|uniref:helix-turn-helix domain-containing protein n=1 Tax=uncultured Ramlibacter sp. TaxID=260755 RepID=UPI0026018FCF|nr:helix-turn-helix domain-containing protein [uncultured Ramlibacter sp.]